MTLLYNTAGVVGAGATGRGIGQIAAQAGSMVKLFDRQPEALARACTEVSAQWSRLVEKGRIERLES